MRFFFTPDFEVWIFLNVEVVGKLLSLVPEFSIPKKRFHERRGVLLYGGKSGNQNTKGEGYGDIMGSILSRVVAAAADSEIVTDTHGDDGS